LRKEFLDFVRKGGKKTKAVPMGRLCIKYGSSRGKRIFFDSINEKKEVKIVALFVFIFVFFFSGSIFIFPQQRIDVRESENKTVG